MSATKKQKTVELPKLPKISDSVEEPVVQTLATVCAKLYDEALFAAWKPADGSEPDDKLDQPYKLSKGGQYKEGGKYKAHGSKYMYTEGEGALVSGYHVFNKDTTQVVEGNTCGKPSLASYGTVIDGFTDFHGVDQAAFPPFAALIVQPKDETEAPILILAWRGSVTVLDFVNDVALSPVLSSRWSGVTKQINAHGMYVSLVENTFSRHEHEIVALALKHKVTRAFITGHSLGGGLANVAHLFVRAGQLKKAGSPWAELAGKVTWLACTFASPQTIVRLYEPEKPPPLMAELDASSYNVVYGVDAVPRLWSMLTYLGAIVEIALPEFLEAETVKEVVPSWFPLKTLIRMGHFLGLDLDGKIDDLTAVPIKFLKNKGLAEVLGQFSHTGTVVYIKDKDLKYVHLEGAEIKETLDVGGDAFEALLASWGKPTDILTLFQHAHSASFQTFMFSAK